MFTLDPGKIYRVTDYRTSPITGKPVAITSVGDGNARRNGWALGAMIYAAHVRVLAARLDY
ncbi:hypothetical protein [Spirillospora sp. CA-128828]|uniref:hypothetical protein n=1 Tax=Spirillospora sp. CA-128828 TaxID=3240033 RepID=UPI003D913EC6